jgi:light-independent protochlorophyllide reductase subunit L
MRVLHVGCDPEHDSSLALVPVPTHFKTVIDQIHDAAEDHEPEDLIMPGLEGIHCVESGGPQAGRGCGAAP